MPKYRKKPVVIEAFQWNQDTSTLPSWAQHLAQIYDGPAICLEISTLEGNMLATPGDWIIRGVKGELYPCKPDIFEQTYEPAGDDDA